MKCFTESHNVSNVAGSMGKLAYYIIDSGRETGRATLANNRGKTRFALTSVCLVTVYVIPLFKHHVHYHDTT